MTHDPATTVEQIDIDRRIIEALVRPEPDLLHALYRSGMTAEAVSARAAQLCLTNDVIRRCRLTGTVPNMRPCLECGTRFLSAGSHNRRCKKCPPR
ncbi:MAG TPA: hypothetical protein VJR89_38440 [Polyangiales bacterium]|nr:hypothetical protein [Polyangiales bacterium]